MDDLALYVVRVYRRDDAGMAGVVESVASGEQLPFQTTEQLWHAIQDLPSIRRRGIDGKQDKGDDT